MAWRNSKRYVASVSESKWHQSHGDIISGSVAA